MKGYWDDISATAPEWDDDEAVWDFVFVPSTKGKTMQVKVGASRMTDEEVLAFVNNVIASGTGKPELLTIDPSLTDLTTAATEADAAQVAEGTALDVLNTKSTTRAEKFAVLRTVLTDFAQAADTEYAHDTADLQAIGLPVRSLRQPVGLLPAPANVRSESGAHEGCIVVRWNKVRGRQVYHVEMAPAPTGPWTQIYSQGDVQTTCAGLTPGAEYWFRVRAVGAAGFSPWSDITRKRAL